MAEVKWIKLTTNMFDDEKIDFIESLPEADSILVIWIKLLTLAGKCNMNGYIFLTENIPYNDEMLAHKFRRPLNTVRLAFETFKKLGMVEIDEHNSIYISNWEKHQNIDGMDRIRELTRERNKKYRERKKQTQLTSGDVNHDVTVTSHDGTDIDIDIDKEKEINTLCPGSENESSKKASSPKSKKIYDDESTFMKMAKYLQKKIVDWKPNYVFRGSLQKWANDFRLMHENDKRSKEDIRSVIDWATTDSFWQANILSPDKLRKQFDTLQAQMKRPKHKSNEQLQQEKKQNRFDYEVQLNRWIESGGDPDEFVYQPE